MEAMRLKRVVEKDGVILIEGLPFRKGQSVEMILLTEPLSIPRQTRLTAQRLLNSGLVGLWKDRRDIKDSSVYARQLREQAQRRRG